MEDRRSKRYRNLRARCARPHKSRMEDCNLRQTGIVKLSEWEGHTFVEPTLPLAFFSLPSHRESRPIAIGKLKLRSLLRFRPVSRRRFLETLPLHKRKGRWIPDNLLFSRNRSRNRES